MTEDLRKQAEKKVQAKMAFYICAVVFSFTTMVLLVLSYYLPSIGFWLRLPIPVFGMVLGILYLAIFGLPSNSTLSKDWREEEIEKEMVKLYRQKKSRLSSSSELSAAEKLELKELEKLEEQWDDDQLV